jgi:hypothetical protein
MDEDEIDRTSSHDEVGDRHVAAHGVPNLGWLHARSVQRVRGNGKERPAAGSGLRQGAATAASRACHNDSCYRAIVLSRYTMSRSPVTSHERLVRDGAIRVNHRPATAVRHL